MEPVSLWLMTTVAGKVLDSMLGDRANKLMGAVVGGVIGNRADRLVSEAARSSWNFFRNLRTQDPSLNHDLERATRESYLLATLELIRQAELRTAPDSFRFLTAGNAEALATIRRGIEADLRNIDNTLPQPLTDAHLFLIDPDGAPAERLSRLRETLRRNLSEDFSRWLPDGQVPAVVDELLRDGWAVSTSRVENVPRDWYSLIAIAFIEKLKTNPRLSTVFESRLLAQIASREPAAASIASFQGLTANLDTITVPLQRIEDALGIVGRDVIEIKRGVGELRRGVDSIGRDVGEVKHAVSSLGRAEASANQHLVAYCAHLTRTLCRVPLLGIDPKRRHVKLANVYVDLDTTSYEEDVGDEAKPLSALNAVTKNDRLVLLGDPGSGKSTFVNYLALCLAAHTATPNEDWLSRLAEWLRDHDWMPVPVALRDFATSRHSVDHDSRGEVFPTFSDLRGFIQDWLDREGLSSAFPSLQGALADGRAIVILDGLDEIPDAAARIRTRDVIADFMEQYPLARYVVTCRSVAYEERLHFERTPAFRIAPLNDSKVESLITGWCSEMVRVRMLQTDEAEVLAEQLRLAVRHTDLRKLSSNPMLLTATAIVGTRKDRPLSARSLVYREAIDLLLWRWGARNVLGKLIREAEWKSSDLESVLSELAYEAQAGTELRDEQAVADIPYTTLVERLVDRRQKADCLDWANRVVTELTQRTGLLVERTEARHVFSFPHRTFQEYLAGKHLSTGTNFASRASGLLSDGPYWLQAVLLGIGHSVHVAREFDSPLFLLTRLCDDSDGEERLWRNAWFAGEALAEFGVSNALADDYGRLVVSRVRQQVSAILERGKLSAGERAKAGAVLGEIGDPRFRADLWSLPSDRMLGFVEIPGGPFTMGSDTSRDQEAYPQEAPPHIAEVENFYIARWPVTVAQFKAFVEAPDNGGFTPDNPECLKGIPNHPVTSVTWKEALSYCRWLTTKLRASPDTPEPLLARLSGSRQPWVVTLPSEAEWERAARGPNASLFPWGNEASPDKANYSATGIGRRTAVGCFPDGRSAFGVEDLCGNAWEWTRSLWGKDRESPHFAYPYVPDYAGNNREDLRASPDVCRIVRGGAAELDSRDIRSSFRFWLEPFRSGRNVGFRVVLAPFFGNV